VAPVHYWWLWPIISRYGLLWLALGQVIPVFGTTVLIWVHTSCVTTQWYDIGFKTISAFCLVTLSYIPILTLLGPGFFNPSLILF